MDRRYGAIESTSPGPVPRPAHRRPVRGGATDRPGSSRSRSSLPIIVFVAWIAKPGFIGEPMFGEPPSVSGGAPVGTAAAVYVVRAGLDDPDPSRGSRAGSARPGGIAQTLKLRRPCVALARYSLRCTDLPPRSCMCPSAQSARWSPPGTVRSCIVMQQRERGTASRRANHRHAAAGPDSARGPRPRCTGCTDGPYGATGADARPAITRGSPTGRGLRPDPARRGALRPGPVAALGTASRHPSADRRRSPRSPFASKRRAQRGAARRSS